MNQLPPELVQYWKDQLEIMWYILYAICGVGVTIIIHAIVTAITNIYDPSEEETLGKMGYDK